MHKVASLPAPKTWTLYLKEGVPVIGQDAINIKYSMDEETPAEYKRYGYLASPDLPVYSAVIKPTGSGNTATKPVMFVTDPIIDAGGRTMLLTFTNPEIIKLLELVAAGTVVPKDGGLLVRFTFGRIGPRIFPKLHYPEIV